MSYELPTQGAPEPGLEGYRDGLHKRIVKLRESPAAGKMQAWLEATSTLTQSENMMGLRMIDMQIKRVEGGLAGANAYEGMEERRARIAALIEEMRKKPNIEERVVRSYLQYTSPEFATDKYFLDFVEEDLRRKLEEKKD